MEKGSQGNIPILLLAAGSSSRMGQSKQLLPVNGTTLLKKTTKTCLEANTGKVIAVLGARESEHRKEIEKLPVDIIFNADWQKGMGSSIKEGIQYLASQSSISEGVIISVCDQPNLSSAHLIQLTKEFRNRNQFIVASAYSNVRGVPALFGHQYFKELMQIEDGSGANKIIRQFSNMVTAVPFPEGAVDLDTLEDYHLFTTNTN